MKEKQEKAASPAQPQAATNAIALLKADHRKVNALFRKFEKADSTEEKASIAKEVCTELIVHTTLEEEIFYAACREAGVEVASLDEAQVEHDSAKVLITGLLHSQPDSAFYDARVTVLAEYIKHHVGEEEQPGSGIFAKARAAKLDLNELGQRMQQRKEELMTQAQQGQLAPSAPRSLETEFLNRDQKEQSTMARQMDRDRDDQGRFTSDDDDRGGNRGRSYSSQDNDRDERGRFMSDDDRSGNGYGNRGGNRGYSSQSNDRDEPGRFTSDDEQRGGDYGRGYSSRSERDEQGRFSSEYENRSGGRGSDDDYRSWRGNSEGSGSGRGWFGDSEGHSRAAQQRGQNRGGSSYGRDEDEGNSGGYGSRERGGGYDSESRYRSSEDRMEGSGNRSRGSRDDDDYRSSGSRQSEGRGRNSQQGSDSGNSRSSRSRDDDQDRGSSSERGHGGWFGDSRGHAEASRRGWQNR